MNVFYFWLISMSLIMSSISCDYNILPYQKPLIYNSLKEYNSLAKCKQFCESNRDCSGVLRNKITEHCQAFSSHKKQLGNPNYDTLIKLCDGDKVGILINDGPINDYTLLVHKKNPWTKEDTKHLVIELVLYMSFIFLSFNIGFYLPKILTNTKTTSVYLPVNNNDYLF